MTRIWIHQIMMRSHHPHPPFPCFRPLPGKKITDIMGTPEYMAPEQIMGSYGPEADIWSAGVVMYVVMCGVPPFWASSRDAVKKAIVEKEVSFKYPKWLAISLECKDLIRRMLIKNPAERISASDVLGKLQHCLGGGAVLRRRGSDLRRLEPTSDRKEGANVQQTQIRVLRVEFEDFEGLKTSVVVGQKGAFAGRPSSA